MLQCTGASMQWWNWMVLWYGVIGAWKLIKTTFAGKPIYNGFVGISSCFPLCNSHLFECLLLIFCNSGAKINIMGIFIHVCRSENVNFENVDQCKRSNGNIIFFKVEYSPIFI